jgi:hypothetical protein
MIPQQVLYGTFNSRSTQTASQPLTLALSSFEQTRRIKSGISVGFNLISYAVKLTGGASLRSCVPSPFTSIDDPITKEAMNAVGSSVFITKESAETFPDRNAKITASPLANDIVS